MGAGLMVIALVGLALPVTLILLAVVLDVAVLLWAAYRMWHDSWSGLLWGVATSRRFVRSMRLGRA